MTTHAPATALDRRLLVPAIGDAFRKLSPRLQFRNPVMFVVFVCSVLTTALWLQALVGHGEASAGFIRRRTVVVVHAAVREVPPKRSPKAAARRRPRRYGARRDVVANKIPRSTAAMRSASARRTICARTIVIVSAGEMIPRWRRSMARRRRRIRGDWRIRAGDPRVRRRPQLRHWRHARAVGLDCRANHQQSGRKFSRPHDRDGRRRLAAQDAERDRTDDPAREIFAHLPARLRDPAAVFAICGCEFRSRRTRHDHAARGAARLSDSDHDRWPAVGDRHRRHGSHDQANVIAMSGRAVEAAGDVDVLLPDKTGTITAPPSCRLPRRAVDQNALADQRSSPRSPTRHRKDAVSSLAAEIWLARARSRRRRCHVRAVHCADAQAASTRGRRTARRRSTRSNAIWSIAQRYDCGRVAEDIARAGGTPLIVADNERALGVIELKDIVKGGIRERFTELRAMGIHSS